MDAPVELLESKGVVVSRAQPLTADEEDFLNSFKAGVQQCFTRILAAGELFFWQHNVDFCELSPCGNFPL